MADQEDRVARLVQEIRELSPTERMNLVGELRDFMCPNCGNSTPAHSCYCLHDD